MRLHVSPPTKDLNVVVQDEIRTRWRLIMNDMHDGSAYAARKIFLFEEESVSTCSFASFAPLGTICLK